MISPHTAPGTPLVVVRVTQDEDGAAEVCAPAWRQIARKMWREGRLRGDFVLRQRVVLAQIVEEQAALQGYAAEIEGYSGRYCLEAFDIATLPRSITSLLETTPVKEDA